MRLMYHTRNHYLGINMLHLYCRVSTTKQIEGLSLSIQGDESAIAELAKKYNTEVGSRVYQDSGKSAFKGVNLDGELGEFLADIESGKVQAGDILVVRALDRISRLGLTKALNVYGQIMASNISIHTTMDDRLYKPNDQLSQILATLAFNTANEESAKKSYLTNKYALTRINQFKAGERNHDGSSFDIGVGKHPFFISLKQKAVYKSQWFILARELIELALQGKGVMFCRNHAKTHGLELSHTAMSRFFKSESLYGRLIVRLEDKEATRKHPSNEKQYHVYELDGYYPALCSKTEFLRISKIKHLSAETSAARKYNISMLAGNKRLYCPNGYSMVAATTKGISHYRCGYTDCKCGTYIPQYSLNKMVLDTLKSHVFVPVEHNNHQLLDLEIELEQKTAEFKKRQRMVLENLHLFDDEAMARLANDKTEIETISVKLEAEREEQATKLSYAGGLSLSHYQEWINKTDMYLQSTDESEIQSIRERLKTVIRRIEVNQGLIKIHLADGTCTVLYQPTGKDVRQRQFLKLQITDEATKEGMLSLNDAMKYLVFTEQDLTSDAHVFKAESYPVDLLQPCSKPVVSKDHKADFLEKIRKAGRVVWKRKHVVAADVRPQDWQAYKDEDMTKHGFVVQTVKYKTKNYVKRTCVVVSNEAIDSNGLLELLNASSIVD